jgi:hypothetical protein
MVTPRCSADALVGASELSAWRLVRTAGDVVRPLLQQTLVRSTSDHFLCRGHALGASQLTVPETARERSTAT